MHIRSAIILLAIVLGTSCNNTTENKQVRIEEKSKIVAIKTDYHLLTNKDSIKNILKIYPENELQILQAVNRVDAANIVKLDTLVVPGNRTGNIQQYSPFPSSVASLKDVDKIIFFSYGDQYFGAYEHGILVYTGPTNMGRKADPTPTGLFFTNWKAEETRSTFNDEWELKWNFNIENKEGIGWHEYAMPGYPASHSCLRLTENDAKYLYTWAREWKLQGTDNIIAKGTPVIVFGSYPFDGTKPWYQLATNAQALNISETQIDGETQPHLNEILAVQQQQEKNAD